MNQMTTISFPGLGIGEFSFSRVAFSLFGKDVYWYGVIILCGIVAAFIHAYIRTKQEGIKEDHLLDLTIFIVLFGVIGARLYYVATTWNGQYKNFIDVIAVWEGGLAIYGGIIAGVLTVIVTCKIKKLNVLKVLDMIGPGVMLGQAIGRWGNFCNGEAYGEVVREGSLLYPFRMGIISQFTGSTMQYYHPTFLYESLWNLVGFVLISFMYKHKKFNGQMILSYLTWYGFGRFFVEGLRTDSLYVGSLRISQVVGMICFIVGGGLLITGFILQSKGRLPASLFAVSLQPIRKQPAPAAEAPAAGTSANETPAAEAPADAAQTDANTAPDETLPADADKADSDTKDIQEGK